MNFSIDSAYLYTKILTLFVFTIQFIEFLSLSTYLKENSVWAIDSRAPSSSKIKTIGQLTLRLFTKYPNIIALIAFRQTLLLSVLILSKPIIYLLIIISSLMILSRWRGNFNGGSDAMSNILIVGLFLGSFGQGTSWEHIGLVYIAIHLCISYFKAGWVKILRPEWRNGTVLNLLFKSSPYSSPLSVFNFILYSPYSQWTCVFVLVFELSFPLALVRPDFCITYILFGFLFHGMILYSFGLNRFFWSWLATYPSLYYTSQLVSHIY